MKVVKIALKAALVLILLAAAAVIAFIALAACKNAWYYKFSSPAGELEKTYTALGPCKVSHVEFDAENETYGKYEVWYPADLEKGTDTYPLIVMVNGTGYTASKYKEVFRHLASWGFIVAGNEDENSRTGASSAATLDFMLRANENAESIFRGKIDTENIGIAGHSQGGVGALNALTAQPNGDRYTVLYTASATSSYWGQDEVFGAEWSYDVSKVAVPCLMVAGTGALDAGTAADITATEGQGICPLWSLEENYRMAPDPVTKVIARRAGKDHGEMLRDADGYMTAWFMYFLKGDTEAGNAFFGENAEILSNTNWQDIQKNR